MSFRWENIGEQAGCSCVVTEIKADASVSKTGKAISISSGEKLFEMPNDLQEIWVRFDLYSKNGKGFVLTNYGRGVTNGAGDYYSVDNSRKWGTSFFAAGLHSYLYRASVKDRTFSIKLWCDGAVVFDSSTGSNYTVIDQPSFFCDGSDVYVSNIIFSDAMLLLTDNAKTSGGASSNTCYLTEDELDAYCTLAEGVTMEHVAYASVLIDAYKGLSLFPKEHTEKVKLRNNRHTGEARGKLRHFPRVEIKEVKAKTRSPFGEYVNDLGVDCIEFDEDDSIYFSFYMPRNLFYREIPKTLTITYTSGFSEIPEDVKRACGIIACNIKQMGGILRWKSRDDYDIKVTLGNDGVMNEEVKQVLDGVHVQ